MYLELLPMDLDELTLLVDIWTLVLTPQLTKPRPATLFYCLNYPPALSRLKDEIRSVFADFDEIRSIQRLDSCQYLRACINEAMRLSPPVGAFLPREILAGGLSMISIFRNA